MARRFGWPPVNAEIAVGDMVKCYAFWPDGRVGEVTSIYSTWTVAPPNKAFVAVVDWRPEDGTRIHLAHHPVHVLERSP